MKIENILLGALIVVIIGVLVFSLTGLDFATKKKLTTEQTTQVSNTAQNGLTSVETGTTNPGDVSVVLTPHEPAKGELRVDYASNTHSVDLSTVDLLKATTLVIGDKVIKPTAAPTLSGHHNSGTIVFPITELPESFTIIIKDIPSVKERVFTW